ncbi:MAG TPA: hypothetical protein VL361_18540 [Candidatus Limnocylindrales bacterium]|jgi:hypothetical protein|nr:hypothetical protein [Candidatus Limnocylindrales bacterium]
MVRRKIAFVPLLTALLLLVFVGACKRRSSELTAADSHAFDSATPELKQQWEIAVQAVNTNGYVVSQTILYDILRLELPAEQRQAAQHELAIVTERFNAALDKGDPEAQAALAELRQNTPNRPR